MLVLDDGDVVLYRFGPVGKCTGLFYWVVVVVGGLGVRGAVAYQIARYVVEVQRLALLELSGYYTDPPRKRRCR